MTLIEDERLPVGRFSLAATQRLLEGGLGRTFSRPTAFRVHEASDGNPSTPSSFARALSADIDPMQPLWVGETLEELVRSRLDDLPSATRQALLLAAAVGRPATELLLAAGVTDEMLEPALAAP